MLYLLSAPRSRRRTSLTCERDVGEWMGDSVGRWEGDTLVVDTTNFNSTPALFNTSENLHVVERFTRVSDDVILYQFTVEDPTVWTAPWSGEYPWIVTEDRLYEYACHEGNYAMEGILRGARLLEAEAEAQASGAGETPGAGD